ncbi:MAG: TrkH family potassium uptake protein, partial [Epsilonproteobacteria bacterium]|nr:TrkH family potassium uptake protein [Campylobacterota bacterium]
MDRKSVIKILKFLALVGVIIETLFSLALFTAYVYHEKTQGFLDYWMISLLVFGLILIITKKHEMKLSIKEAILSVNLVWIMGGVLGAIPLMILTNVSFINGFFESVSGFTTTGATIYSDITHLPKSALMLRSTMHWIGGMGIIVLSIGLLSLINPTASLALFKSEATGITPEKITPKLKQTALKLWQIYILITFLDVMLLKIEGMNWFDAINHAFSTISTGGFSTKSESLGFWINNPWILWTTTIFMLISGINFIAYIKALRGDFSGFKSEEVRWYLALFVILSAILTLIHYFQSNDSLFFDATNAFFTISSILTTTGFATIDYTLWGQAAIAVIFIAMFLGGNAGSTAGGPKIIRYIVMFKNLKFQIKKF